MRSLVTILTLVLLSGLYSCTKIGRNITIKGKVINPVSNEPFEGIEVLFQRTTNQLPGGYKTIKEDVTDANGEFEINATRIGTHYIRLGDVKGNYRLGWYENGEYTSTSVKEVDKGKVMNVEYHLVPYGELTLDIQNINCESVEDTMWFRRKWEFDDDYGNWSPPRVGCFSQSAGSNGSKVPIGNRTYQIRVKRSGVETVTEETFFIEENELTVIQLHY